jgi:hydroxyacylglutathione hydrolase
MMPVDVRAVRQEDATVLDMRLPRLFAREHLPGAVNLQFNRADLVDRAEMVLPKDARFIVHAEPEAIAKIAVDLLSGAGFRVLGHLEGGLKAWKDAGEPTESIPVMGVEELHRDGASFTVVDVRERFEFKHGHVPGAALLVWTEAWARAGEAPDHGLPLAVMCGDEVRSSLVSSILRRHGRDVRLVVGGMVDWLEHGYAVEKA